MNLDWYLVDGDCELRCLGVETLADLSSFAAGWPVAVAYMGPGSGLAAIGAFVAVVGVAVFMAVGFVWYPLRRLRTALRHRRGKATAVTTKLEARYSPPERFLHHMAFSTIPVQKALADLEGRLYAPRIAGIGIERPVFIASLPRAGTTVLLESLCSSGAFTTHTYRNMPFLFIPLLWNAISRGFHLAETRLDRAHGDGVKIGYDSAEAFEETLWRAFHPRQYMPDRVLPWAADFASNEFDAFLKDHIRKLIALQVSKTKRDNQNEGGRGRMLRYISKNNGNLSRLSEIRRLFPDATVLVPLRNPIAHAASLLRTHIRFAEIHARETFTRRYMEDIGHFDFGANLRPIDFDHWLDRTTLAPHDANFWLTYWCAAFGHVLANLGDHVVVVDYDGLCGQPQAHLERVAAKIALTETGAAAAGHFRVRSGDDAPPLEVDKALADRALALHRQLLAHCVD